MTYLELWTQNNLFNLKNYINFKNWHWHLTVYMEKVKETTTEDLIKSAIAGPPYAYCSAWTKYIFYSYI